MSAIVEITGRQTWKQNWKQTFDCKLLYILGKTVQDMVLDSYSDKYLVVSWRRSDVFNFVFETTRHLFLVFLLLTLNIVVVFLLNTLWAKLHNCNLLSYRNETSPETSLGLFSWANKKACEWHSSYVTIISTTDIF